MSIRLWPQDYERKDHISASERAILRYASRNFSSGHMAVGIDPLGMSNNLVKMGMYISPTEGLLTFSLYTGKIDASRISAYRTYVEMVENKIHERLLDSKILIIRNGQKKALKFPYKHIIVFPDETPSKNAIPRNNLISLLHYATFDSFRPIDSLGKEKRIDELKIFDGIRCPYDKTFKSLSELECRAIFERLAPEYTVVINEPLKVQISEKRTFVSDDALKITGNEVEYKTFFLDEYQVGVVNDMGKGHRVILANPGAGKSVLLLSKAFKYASIYKDSKVLLTCYNNNLADSYNFKKNCANFGENNNLFIMTFHKLVKKIYEECLHSHCDSNIASAEEIQKCIDLAKSGRLNLKFKAIFIDEVQIFDPLYLELCYYLLEEDEDRVFLMAGDLNQAVRTLSRKGDAPWKRMNGIKLDFTGRVRYVEKNYRNSKEIGEYISDMLQHMNKRLTMMDLINSLEYEYNSFKIGDTPTTALKIITAINRGDIKEQVINAIREIASKYKISYSNIAVLFPFRQVPFLKYYFLFWLQQGLDEEGIPYSMIINDSNGHFVKTKQGDINGVVISTIESSLGLDFKAVILAGLFPYSYVNNDGLVEDEIKTWESLGYLSDVQQSAVQSQMRAIYTASSRARDVLYVLSDIKKNSVMEEIIKAGSNNKYATTNLIPYIEDIKHPIPINSNVNNLQEVIDNCVVKAIILDSKKETSLTIDLKKYPTQQHIIGKKVGDTFKLPKISLTYKITEIKPNTTPPENKNKSITLYEYFSKNGFKVVDNRSKGGSLWVIGERKQLEPHVKIVKNTFGISGSYGTGKASNYKNAWYTNAKK